MRLPDFLIIGAAKAGTTTLYQYLCRHPQIFMSTPKEPEFFARDINYCKGITWYSSLFEAAKSTQICGEASTAYTMSCWFPETASRIAKALPEVKLIYLLRHPVDRSYSHYVQAIKTAQNTGRQLQIQETFEEVIQRNSLLEVSDYMLQIEKYLRFFTRDSFLFLFLDELIDEPAENLSKVCKFLGVDSSIDLVQNKPITANQAHTHFEQFMQSRITNAAKKIPGVAYLATVLPDQTRSRAYQILKQLPSTATLKVKYCPQPMLPETRQKLLERFWESNQKLAEFLNRDLSSWSK